MRSKWKYTEGSKGNLKDIMNYLVNEGDVWVNVEIYYEDCDFCEDITMRSPGYYFRDKKAVEEFGFDYNVEIIALTSGEALVDMTVKIGGIWDEV